MDVALVTVGDELLAGDTVNTNAAWLAARITDRGGRVGRVLTLPDDRALVADYVHRWREEFDAMVVTGGIGGTPDDVTVEAVADALGRDLVVDPGVRERLVEKAEQFRRDHPEMAAEFDFDYDLDDAASLPAGARPLLTDDGWAPGCTVENVHVLPGIPDEMRAAFELVADEFDGDLTARVRYTSAPEGALGDVLAAVHERFDVSVGSYPGAGETPGRLKVSGTDEAAVADATAWLEERVDIVDPPAEDVPLDSPAEDVPLDSPAEDVPLDSPAEDLSRE